MKTSTYKRSRKIWEETAAFEDVMKKEGWDADQLVESHTETHFVWTYTYPDLPEWQLPVRYRKEDYTEAEAKVLAGELLETFEANLQEQHSATHWAFAKVRE